MPLSFCAFGAIKYDFDILNKDHYLIEIKANTKNIANSSSAAKNKSPLSSMVLKPFWGFRKQGKTIPGFTSAEDRGGSWHQ